MVRDETVEEEPDIDDIDATLEELDDQAGAVEERLAPELEAGDSAAQPDATPTTTDASASVVAPSDVAHAAAPSGDATAAEVSDASALAVFPEVNTDDAAVAAEGESVEGQSSEAEARTSVRGAKARAQHHQKRHWRPRRLALDFAPGEVVSVTRRLYRDGESEYLLNGRICRLRDIQDLFSGTGLSGAHYAIIEQGRIGQILSAKPMDRRTLIEEAAGITKFRVRQRAAEARLDAARTNLSRVSDIISEIERQVGSLRRQAAKARRYHQLREELRELLRKVYAADEHALTSRLEELRENLSAANEEVERFVSELEEREEDARRATAIAREREEELATERAAVSESALRLDRRERERTYQGEQIAALERRLEEIRREAEAVSARIASVTAESESLVLRDVQMREETEATARQLHEAEDAYARRVA
jgi:chromosome segregation protein